MADDIPSILAGSRGQLTTNGAGIVAAIGVGPNGGARSGSATYAQGALRTPSASANGTELTGRPGTTNGVRFYSASGGSVTYYFGTAGGVPGGAPANTVTFAPSASGVQDEPLAGSDAIFVTAVTGSVLYRWILI